ncbi:MAG: BrxA/BrxB family bacilliredoxin [Candidatus Dadabacteria bacterium]|nr:MAG: BrxA/BrxB family bacilliredoxin [Candidatus Dadabacteria bacterium]
MYDENLVAPMRKELTDIGFVELRTAEQVEQVLEDASGTVLVFVNSVCGCSAGCARPAVRIALERSKKPDKLVTVFAGQDAEATAKAREYFAEYPPSSPSMALLKDGEVVDMIQRHDIEGRSAEEVAARLVEAFNLHC